MYTLIDSPNSLTDDSIAHHMSKKAFHPIEKINFLTKSIYGHMHFRLEMGAKKPSRLKLPPQLMVFCAKGIQAGKAFIGRFYLRLPLIFILAKLN